MSERKSSEDRKAEILAATLALAFEVGPAQVTTVMIAARLGLTQPAIYKHFPKKEDVWRAVSEELYTRITENAQQEKVAGLSPLDALRKLVMSHIELVAQTPALPEIMVSRNPTGDLTDARGRIQAAMGQLRRAVTRELDRARAAGQLREGLRTEDGITLVFGVIQILALQLIVTRNPAPLAQEGKRLLDLQLSLFAGEGDDA
ncbi:TetR/AcrR family transcriptional regulator [Phaeovulum sp.]|uniref:TetR/AcrR family transcriptional regulator n=1 Tax=Phaeovulum sp. TaxID=2934796 RepID=UPI003563BEC0